MKFKPGDICINPPSWKSGCWLIRAIDGPNPKAPYRGISLFNKKLFFLCEEGLIKIGEISSDMTIDQAVALLTTPPPEAPLPAENSPEYIKGKARAEVGVLICRPEEEKYWKCLAKAKPGDQILISMGRRPEMVTFHNVLDRGEKYVFLATDRKGKVFRYPLDVIILEP